MNKASNHPSTQNQSSAIPDSFIFIALECEAKPLLAHYNLKKDSKNHPFSIYKNKGMILCVTGIGKIAMAGGVAYTMALFPYAENPVLLNLGIAGHKTRTIGQLVTAIKIIDVDTDKKYYPSLIANNISESSVLHTVSRPCETYVLDNLYDMEASAFYEIAIKFSSIEFIQCIKVISDNEDVSIKNIHAKLVTQWISEQISLISVLIENLLTLRETLIKIELDEYAEIISQWHFTVSSKLKLKNLLTRWKVLTSNASFNYSNDNLKNAKEILLKLEADINKLAISL